MRKILAIDYGDKRIGLATSEMFLAEPYDILLNSEQVYEGIRTICNQESITDIIIGLSENQTADKTRAFADKLKEYINLPIEFVDETLSSQAIEEKIRNGEIKKKKFIDDLAAAHFLQEYLDSHSPAAR